MNFSNSDEIAKASKCFSAASLTAHFSMKHSGTKQDLKVFVHVGFEKNWLLADDEDHKLGVKQNIRIEIFRKGLDHNQRVLFFFVDSVDYF